MALVFYPTKYQIPGLQSRHFHFLEVDQVCTFDRHVGREVLLQSESSPPIPIRIVIKKKKEKLYFLLSHLYTWKQGLDLWSSIQARFTKLSLSYPYCCSDCISPNSRPAHCGPGMLSFSRLLALADPSPSPSSLSNSMSGSLIFRESFPDTWVKSRHPNIIPYCVTTQHRPGWSFFFFFRTESLYHLQPHSQSLQ